MSALWAGLASLVLLVLLLAACRRPLGDWIARVFTDKGHWRVERLIYRLGGINPDSGQSAKAYALSVVGFSLVGLAVLMVILMTQSNLPWSRGLDGMGWSMAFNTAISFVANTNWQSYAGESTLGFAAQMAGLAVQNFLSAAVGIAVAVALIRGFVRVRSTDGLASDLGNFWVDLTRGTVRVLLPIAAIGAVVLMIGGVVQNFADVPAATLEGGRQLLTGGPVASQEAIKLLGTNGGGFFNANSAHPFENPSAWTNLFEIFLILLIPVALTRTVGTLLGDQRQGRMVLGAMGVLMATFLAVTVWAESGARSLAGQAAGAALEGKEVRFGEWGSALFAVATTGTSTGAVNSAHDSFTPVGGGAILVNMMLGEIAPGGVGSGIYGMLIMAIVAVFVCGLMVGRTPEIFGKKIGATQMKFVALYILTTPTLVLLGTGLSVARSDTADALGNPGAHGFSELLYAFTSAANNNGSAFGGITVTSDWFQVMLGLAMLLGRLVPIVLVILLAGSLAQQPTIPATAGTLATHTRLFTGLLVGVIFVMTALTYFPALALGPIAEALS